MRATCAAYLICLDFNIFHFPCITFKQNAGQFVCFITTYYLPLHISTQLSDIWGNQVQEKTCMKTIVYNVTGMRS
jgi:hypothetical protein